MGKGAKQVSGNQRLVFLSNTERETWCKLPTFCLRLHLIKDSKAALVSRTAFRCAPHETVIGLAGVDLVVHDSHNYFTNR